MLAGPLARKPVSHAGDLDQGQLQGGNMRKLLTTAAAATALALAALAPTAAEAGCYRLGETGYHWYRFCFGPSFIYPHYRVCRHGYCWYQ
jgi:hypothetical protein